MNKQAIRSKSTTWVPVGWLTCNDVLAGLLDGTLDHRVGLGQPLQALNQLGQVGCHLGLNSHTHLHTRTINFKCRKY